MMQFYDSTNQNKYIVIYNCYYFNSVELMARSERK